MIGKTLNHYRILESLGKGGMGEVYLAEDTRLERRVALKILPVSVASDPDRLARFTREAKAIAALNHPSIVTIHSVEEAGDLHFLVMEHIEGESLDRHIPKGGMPLDRLLDVATPLADALAAAHDRGITHRDLKPANVMITDAGRVKILDFGLAKHAAEAAPGSATQLPTEEVTQRGLVMGTLPYMSPEQVEGKSLDHRSDIFSLGVVLHEMACGSRPFEGSSSAALVSAILRDATPPLTDVRPEIPLDLARIIGRCLMKDPMARIQTARDVHNELRLIKQQIDSGQALLTGSSAGFAAASLTKKPKRALLAWSVAGAILIIAAAGWWLLRSGPGQPGTGSGPAPRAALPAADRKMIVILPFENLGSAEDDYFAAGMAEEITTRLASVTGLGVISRKSAMSYAGTDKTIRQIGEELGVDYVMEGTIRWARTGEGASRVRITPNLIRVSDDTQIWAETYDRVIEDIFDVQSEIATRVTEQLGVSLLEPDRATLHERPTDNVEAYQSYLRGRKYSRHYDFEGLKLAAELLQRSTEMDPDFTEAHALLARIHAMIIHFGFDTSAERDRMSREAAERALALDPGSASAHVAMGFYHYHAHKDYDAAMREFDAAAALRPDDPDMLFGSALVLRRQGKWDESTRRLERARALDPRDEQALVDLGQNYLETGRVEDALRTLEAAETIRQDLGWVYFYQALTHWAGTGDLAAARRVLGEAPPGDQETKDFYWTMQLIYEHDFEGALKHIDGCTTEFFVLGSVESPREFYQAWVRELKGDRAGALRFYEIAGARMEDEVASGSPRGKRLRSTLGLVYAALGRREDALREGRTSAEQEYSMSRDAVWGDRNLRDLAWIQARVGDLDGAFDTLERLIQVPQEEITSSLARLDPRWDALRGHPRWPALLAKLR